MNAPRPAVTVELFYVADKPAGRRWEAIVPNTMGCGGTPMSALTDLSNKLAKENP